MKQLFYILIVLGILSCSKDDKEILIEEIDGLTITSYKTNHSLRFETFDISYNSQVIGYYRIKGSSDNFTRIEDSKFDLINHTFKVQLKSYTDYEFYVKVTKGDNSEKSKIFNFKSNWLEINKRLLYSQAYDVYEEKVFSYAGAYHNLGVIGVDNTDDLEMFLVNENGLDSVRVNYTLKLDTLTFQVPNLPFSTEEYEIYRNMNIHIKYKERVKELEVNLTTGSKPISLRVYNIKPYINRVFVLESKAECTQNLYVMGYFGNHMAHKYSPAERGEMYIYDSNMNLLKVFEGKYGGGNPQKCNTLWIAWLDPYVDKLLHYHLDQQYNVRLDILEKGNKYYFKNLIYLKSGEVRETNIFPFEYK